MENTKENYIKIEHLLQNVKTLINTQKKNEKLRGESFNIFSILKLEHYEEQTHSAFIKELLNPKGSHLMENAFFKLFIKMLKNKGIPNIADHLSFPIKKVLTEKSIGKVKNTEGGRIDIYRRSKR